VVHNCEEMIGDDFIAEKGTVVSFESLKLTLKTNMY
jgi:hypothetical protein